MNPNLKILVEALQNIQSHDHPVLSEIARVALDDFDNAVGGRQKVGGGRMDIGAKNMYDMAAIADKLFQGCK